MKPARATSPPIEQSRETKLGLLKARIVFFRDMGMVDYVAKMERELAELEARTERGTE